MWKNRAMNILTVISVLSVCVGLLAALPNKADTPIPSGSLKPLVASEGVERMRNIEEPQYIDASAGVERNAEETPEYTKMTVVVTAYCACEYCCGKTDGITSTGTIATAGRTIAADPGVIPYGTEVIINGNTYIVEDCGGAIKGNRIDIFFPSHAEALVFGIQELTAYISE